MPTYTVQAVHGSTPKPDTGYGAMQEIAFDLHDGSQTFRDTKWFTKGSTPLPGVGSTIDGEITEDPKWGLKFKKPKMNGSFNGNGGGGGYKKDPEVQRSIIRQHSQEMAIRYITATGREILGIEGLKPIIDWFDADAFGAAIPTLEQAVASLPVTVPVVPETEKIPF